MGISAVSFNPSIGKVPLKRLKKLDKSKSLSKNGKTNHSIFKNPKLNKKNKMSISQMANAIKESRTMQGGAGAGNAINNFDDFLKFFRGKFI